MSRLFIIAGPTGVGKSYLMHRLLEEFPTEFEFPKLYTTRAPRANEQAIDREFISQGTFDTMLANGEFFWSEQSYGNSYGYTPAAIRPAEKHLMINIYPSMLPYFESIPGVVMIGLNVAPEHLDLLVRRIKQRGDAADTLAKRLNHVETDVQDLQQHREIVNNHGQMFEITDDKSLDLVIAWIEDKYIKVSKYA
jgi:guanylate kinase